MNHKLVQAYKNFLTSPKYLKDEDIRFLLAIYSCKNHRASATDLTKLLGESHFIRINDRVGKIGKKIANYLNLDFKKRERPCFRRIGVDQAVFGKVFFRSK